MRNEIETIKQKIRTAYKKYNETHSRATLILIKELEKIERHQLKILVSQEKKAMGLEWNNVLNVKHC